MKIARTLAAMALVGALAVPALQAQQGPPEGPRGPGMMGGRGMMMGHRQGALPGRGIAAALESRAELGLTEEQVAELEALQEAVRATHEGQRERMQALRGEVGADRAALRERMRELREEMRADHEPFRGRLQEILTEEQHERLMELRPGRGAGPRGPAGPHRGMRHRVGGGGG